MYVIMKCWKWFVWSQFLYSRVTIYAGRFINIQVFIWRHINIYRPGPLCKYRVNISSLSILPKAYDSKWYMLNKVSNYTHLHMLIFLPYEVIKAKGNKYLRKKAEPQNINWIWKFGNCCQRPASNWDRPNRKGQDKHMNAPESMRLNIRCVLGA